MPALLTCLAALWASQSPPTDWPAEAARVTKETISHFFDPKAGLWKPETVSAESVGTKGYTFWPSLLAWQAVIEAAKVDAKNWKPSIDQFYDALEQYFDPSSGAYCAWLYYPGNDDHFYDDNGWAVVACMEAYEVTHEDRYKRRAIEILDTFVKGGWDDSGSPGGMRWGTKPLQDRRDRTVSATAACALAALLVARVEKPDANRQWAKKLLDWIQAKLSDPNGLVYDGFRSPSFTRMNTLWTYNTGVSIRAALEYYDQTGSRSSLAWAVRMGGAAIDRSLSPLYDGSVAALPGRYCWDGIYFVHYLVDGLRLLSLRTGDPRYLAEAKRNAEYCYAYLRDSDGLYWRNMRLWMIDASTQAAFQRLTGQSTPALAPDASERSMAPAELAKPVAQRPMVKTLLANASAARMFWLLSH